MIVFFKITRDETFVLVDNITDSRPELTVTMKVEYTPVIIVPLVAVPVPPGHSALYSAKRESNQISLEISLPLFNTILI